MLMLRMTGVGLFLLIAGAVGAQQTVEVTVPLDSANRHSGKSYSYPVLVLRSGERIPYARYRIANGLVEVHAPDGGFRTFDREELDLEATVRAGNADSAPELNRRRASNAHGSNTRTGLAAFAETATLGLPEPNQQPIQALEVDLSMANLIEIKPVTPNSHGSPSDRAPASEQRVTAEVEDELAALRIAQRRLSRGLKEVSTDCGGHTVGQGTSCSGGSVVARRHTATCQDAVRRARAEVPQLHDALARLRVQWRKSGMSLGELRSFMKRQGIEALDSELRETDADLAAWQRNTRD